ncbi:MAG: peroxidase family protein [Acidobacteriota bacterium]
MRDVSSGSESGDSAIPPIFTYFGQFLDHDITLEESSATVADLVEPGLTPLPVAKIRQELKNTRTATLDLDSVYDPPALRDGPLMVIGDVTPLNGTDAPTLRPKNKDDKNDLKRKGRSPQIEIDREALIGDPRNDENTVVAQLHVAFLRAHNAIVKQGKSFEQARRLLRQHYQHIVINDFLKTVADSNVVDKILKQGNQVFDGLAEPFFMPLEFSVAAYRFGHSMVRAAYDFNLNFNRAAIPAPSRRRSTSCSPSLRFRGN